jgi:hypothetical protein
MLAESFLRALPFRLQAYGSSYMLLQLPQVAAVVSSSEWRAFQQQVLSSHEHYEKQRQSPLAVAPAWRCWPPSWRAGWTSWWTRCRTWRWLCRSSSPRRLLQHSRSRMQHLQLQSHLRPRLLWCRRARARRLRFTAARSRRWRTRSRCGARRWPAMHWPTRSVVGCACCRAAAGDATADACADAPAGA